MVKKPILFLGTLFQFDRDMNFTTIKRVIGHLTDSVPLLRMLIVHNWDLFLLDFYLHVTPFPCSHKSSAPAVRATSLFFHEF